MLAIYGPAVTSTAISFEIEVPTVDDFATRLSVVQESDPWLVAEGDGGQVVGYAYAAPFRSRAAYGGSRETTVYVHPDHRRLGVAESLMQELLARLVEQQVHVVVAGIVLPNDASIALHQRLGFDCVGTFHQVGHKFGRRHDLSFWERPLDSGNPPGGSDRSVAKGSVVLQPAAADAGAELHGAAVNDLPLPIAEGQR